MEVDLSLDQNEPELDLETQSEIKALATLAGGGNVMDKKKTRKTPSHPPPLWKEDDWRLTRKLLTLLLEPSHDILRRALWPRVGETTVGGSKIEYQTDMAKLTLAGWAEEDHVKQDPRWYGNRVKDWMHKLPKIYAECEKEIADAANAQGVTVEEWVQNGKISARCPVYRELQQLLGSAIGIPPLPQLPSMYQVPHASASTDTHSSDLSLDPSLNVSGPSLMNTMHLPMAVVLERITANGNGSSDRRKHPNDGAGESIATLNGLDWTTDTAKKHKGVKRDRSVSSAGTSSDFETELVTLDSAQSRENRKQRKLDLHHTRALRRDEMEQERFMAEMREKDEARKERAREREFELEKLRLQLALRSGDVPV